MKYHTSKEIEGPPPSKVLFVQATYKRERTHRLRSVALLRRGASFVFLFRLPWNVSMLLDHVTMPPSRVLEGHSASIAANVGGGTSANKVAA